MLNFVIVTGIPGTGKTTISKILSEQIDGIHIDISKVVKYEGLYTEFDEEKQTLIVDLVKLENHIKLLTLNEKRTIILDGHLAPQVVPSNEVIKAFVLRRAPWELEKLLEDRGWSTNKIKENVEAELIDVALVDTINYIAEERICEINVTGKTSEEIVMAMLEILEGNKPCEIGIVDWLADNRSRRLLK